MTATVFTTLILNAALLMAVVLVLDLVAARRPLDWLIHRPWLAGILLGTLGIGVMTVPLTLVPGLVFDVRSVLLAVSGLFFGALPAAVAMALTAAYRLSLGGVGTWVGVAVILASGLIGLAWRYGRRPTLEAMGWRELYVLGLVVHVVMLVLMLIMPWELAREAWVAIGLPVLVIYPLLTAALGLLLSVRLARQNVNQGLKESGDRLKLALEAANQGIYDLDVCTGEAIVSPEYALMLGYDPARFHETNAAWIERLHPDDHERVTQVYLDYIAGRIPEYRVEFRMRTASGDWKWMLSLGKVVERDAEGRPLRMLGTHTDITARKQAEAALRESREQMQLFIEHAPAALAMFDRDMNYLNVSQRWLTDYGLGGADIIGRCHYEVFPEISERWKQVHRRALAGEVIRAEDDPFERSDGTVQWLRWEVRPWYCSEGRVGGIVVFTEDITARKQAEEALRQSEERLQDALNYARIGYWELRRDGQALWSKQIYQLFGVPADFQPSLEGFYEVAHGSDCPAVIESLQRSLATGVEHHVEFRMLHQEDGVERWLECRGKPIMGKDGVPEKLVGFMQDITGRKHTEEEIQRLNTDLERRVAERTAELTVANRELDAFAYAVSHDLRAPLRAMSGFSHALAEDFGDQLQGEALRYLEQIDTASGRMSELIDGLLALSRSTRGEMRHEAVDLSTLSRRLLDDLARGDPERRVVVEVEPGLMAWGDGRMLEVVMRNLLGNAWKYSINAPTPNIRVVAEARNGVGHFCVADNGAGFDMSHAGKLFQPFQRLHRQDEFPGLGIGLATVQRIVHRHGGVIEARGWPDKGAIFCFSLSGMPGDAPADEKETGR
jgi:PAS domain S-box-containing protein